jgi:hypothetical protein
VQCPMRHAATGQSKNWLCCSMTTFLSRDGNLKLF